MTRPDATAIDRIAALPAAHLNLVASTIAEDQWLPWTGGAPQDGEGRLYQIGRLVWLPAGSHVEVPEPPSRGDLGWAIITYPTDAGSRWQGIVADQQAAREGRPATREELLAAGMPAEWTTAVTQSGEALQAYLPRNLPHQPWPAAADAQFFRVAANGTLFGQEFGGDPWRRV